MAYFNDTSEVYRYIGGAFRAASAHAEVGPKLRAGNLVLRLNYSNPTAVLTIVMREPAIEVIEGDTDIRPDVVLSLSADNANRFWRGDYNVAVGLAKGEVKAKGPVTKILKLIPITKPVFPLYRELVADKDATR